MQYRRDDSDDARDWQQLYDDDDRRDEYVSSETTIGGLSARTSYEFLIRTELYPDNSFPPENPQTDFNENIYEDFDCPTRHACRLPRFEIDDDIVKTTTMIPMEWEGFDEVYISDEGRFLNIYEYRLQHRWDREG